jgi:hypothetical protein
MASLFSLRTMARHKNPLTGSDLPLNIPAETNDYLILLGSLGKLGKNRTEVAVHILVRECHRMDDNKFHERQVPKPKMPTALDDAANNR